jgi:RimJ/RimL family protein N-acetyltransferase
MAGKRQMKYFKKMIGEKCYLSPINIEDLEVFTEMLNDIEVTRNLLIVNKNITLQTEKEYLQNLSQSHEYSIIDSSTDTLIWNCGLMNIDHLNRTAETGIFIGKKNYWNKGYGEEALELLMDYSFQYLNLRNIMLTVYSFNERACACYQKIGFKEIGRRRNALVRENKEHDIIYMDLLNTEFNK